MAIKVIMPKQGLQMTEGTITSWLVKEGGKAIKDEPLFEMETDKLTITIDSPASGTLLKIIKEEGETVPITETIAVIGDAGEDISAFLSEGSNNNEPLKEEKSRVLISPRAKNLAQGNNIDIENLTASGPEGMIVEKDVTAYMEKRTLATPLAKKAADIEGVDISKLTGTGPRGKITRDDVLAQIPAETKNERLVPLTGMRRSIAKKMHESLANTAQATVQVQVDMSECERARARFKSSGKKISFTELVLKAVCKALIDHPEVNSEWTDNGILQKYYVNMGVAVALDEGLIVPVIKNAHTLSLEQISQRVSELAQKAKSGAITPDECTGGSFTVSNMGMFKIDSFTAILNPPETGILAVGAVKNIPAAVEGRIEIRPAMLITLTYDHRVVDGATAAKFTASVREYLENPYMML